MNQTGCLLLPVKFNSGCLKSVSLFNRINIRSSALIPQFLPCLIVHDRLFTAGPSSSVSLLFCSLQDCLWESGESREV